MTGVHVTVIIIITEVATASALFRKAIMESPGERTDRLLNLGGNDRKVRCRERLECARMWKHDVRSMERMERQTGALRARIKKHREKDNEVMKKPRESQKPPAGGGAISFGSQFVAQLATLSESGKQVTGAITKELGRLEEKLSVPDDFESPTISISHEAAKKLLEAAERTQALADALRAALESGDEEAALRAAGRCTALAAQTALLSQSAAVAAHAAVAAKAGYAAKGAVQVKTRDQRDFSGLPKASDLRRDQLREERKEYAKATLENYREGRFLMDIKKRAHLLWAEILTESQGRAVDRAACWDAILADGELASIMGRGDEARGQKVLLAIKQKHAFDPAGAEGGLSQQVFCSLYDPEELEEQGIVASTTIYRHKSSGGVSWRSKLDAAIGSGSGAGAAASAAAASTTIRKRAGRFASRVFDILPGRVQSAFRTTTTAVDA